jgi:signal transduction histidine kinase
MQASPDNRDWQRFLDATVHDLRAALRAIGTSAELLAQTCGAVPGTRETAITLLDGVRRLDGLSKGLGSYSRALQPDRQDALVPAEAVLRSAMDELREPIQTSGAAISYGALPQLLGNHERIAMLFREILTNALAYRAEVPRIEITALPEQAGMWRFAVRDNGFGIEQRHWEKIFLPFQRLHSRPRGNGLGLAICAKIVRGHGGAIWVESEPGVGSTFFFTLPGVKR